jgi:hypothetical protein
MIGIELYGIILGIQIECESNQLYMFTLYSYVYQKILFTYFCRSLSYLWSHLSMCDGASGSSRL